MIHVLFWLAVGGAVASFAGGPGRVILWVTDNWMWLAGAWAVLQIVVYYRKERAIERLEKAMGEQWRLLSPEAKMELLGVLPGPEGSPNRKCVPDALLNEMGDDLLYKLKSHMDYWGQAGALPLLLFAGRIEQHVQLAKRLERQSTVAEFEAAQREYAEEDEISPAAPEESPASP